MVGPQAAVSVFGAHRDNVQKTLEKSGDGATAAELAVTFASMANSSSGTQIPFSSTNGFGAEGSGKSGGGGGGGGCSVRASLSRSVTYGDNAIGGSGKGGGPFPGGMSPIKEGSAKGL
jgi:hypothetical protein